MQRVSLLNGKNKNYDFDFSALFDSCFSPGIITGFELENNKISPGKAFVEVDRFGQKFCVLFELKAEFEINLEDNEKLFIEINQEKIEDGNQNNEDGTGIGEIKKGLNYPEKNFLKLYEKSGENLLDKRKFIEAKEVLGLTKMGNSFNAKNKLVKLDEEGKLPAVSGANLTGISAGITGEIRIWSTAIAPAGWLICDGKTVSRTIYSELFKIIGTSFGAGNGSTTFSLPNLKGKVVAGIDSLDGNFNGVGKTGGSKTNSHTHGYSIPPSGYSYTDGRGSSGYQGVFCNTGSGSNVGRQSGSKNLTSESSNISLLQPYMALNYIIKI